MRAAGKNQSCLLTERAVDMRAIPGRYSGQSEDDSLCPQKISIIVSCTMLLVADRPLAETFFASERGTASDADY